jgi:Spy/CpxP family protein refolding chaperone
MYGRRFLVGLAGVVSIVAGLTLAQNASAPADPAERFIHRRIARLSRRLGLSDAQQEQVQNMLRAEVPRLRPMLQQLAQQKQQMLATTTNGQFEQGKVTEIANQEAQTLAALIVPRQDIESKVYALLTVEQRTKFDQVRQHRLRRMQGWLAGSGAASN